MSDKYVYCSINIVFYKKYKSDSYDVNDSYK